MMRVIFISVYNVIVTKEFLLEALGDFKDHLDDKLKKVDTTMAKQENVIALINSRLAEIEKKKGELKAETSNTSNTNVSKKKK